MKVKFKKLSINSKLPIKAHISDACYDLFACINESIYLKPGERSVIPCGFAMEMEDGWEAQIRPRSGNAAKSGLTVLNTPGTIDSSYRGEIKVIFINLDKEETFIITPGFKLAQMKFSKVYNVEIEEVDELNDSERGSLGFGSSGC